MKHTKGEWKAEGQLITCEDLNIAFCGYHNKEQAEANAKLMAASPKLFQMVIDLKSCIKRLTQDDVSQFDRDLEANWEGEAHELLTNICPDYYRNANEKEAV